MKVSIGRILFAVGILLTLIVVSSTQSGVGGGGQSNVGGGGGGTFTGGTITTPILAPDGGASAPAYSFSGATNMGIARGGTTLQFIVGGAQIVQVTAAGITNFLNSSASTYTTGTNCAAVGTTANPSVSSCSSAAAGSISCAATETSCQVNTTAVTANSEIFLTQREDTTTGTRLGVTCNTTPSTVVASQNLTTVVAGTSFTFAVTAPTTNPDCFSYWIVN